VRCSAWESSAWEYQNPQVEEPVRELKIDMCLWHSPRAEYLWHRLEPVRVRPRKDERSQAQACATSDRRTLPVIQTKIELSRRL
jgi:hypothetical protein